MLSLVSAIVYTIIFAVPVCQLVRGRVHCHYQWNATIIYYDDIRTAIFTDSLKRQQHHMQISTFCCIKKDHITLQQPYTSVCIH
jgi:hypothetical protein